MAEWSEGHSGGRPTQGGPGPSSHSPVTPGLRARTAVGPASITGVPARHIALSPRPRSPLLLWESPTRWQHLLALAGKQLSEGIWGWGVRAVP